MEFGYQLILAFIIAIPMFLAYCITSLRFTRSFEDAFKDKKTKLSFFIVIFVFIALIYIPNNFAYNHTYSIAMPTITGEFKVSKDNIYISGLSNIIGDSIATLIYKELNCIPSRKFCSENYFGILGLGNQISIFPYHKEYKIKYIDKNKVIFDDGLFTSGEIDLNSKNLVYTVKNAGFNANETRKIEIITDNKEIEKLEKIIIKKHLRKKLFN